MFSKKNVLWVLLLAMVVLMAGCGGGSGSNGGNDGGGGGGGNTVTTLHPPSWILGRWVCSDEYGNPHIIVFKENDILLTDSSDSSEQYSFTKKRNVGYGFKQETSYGSYWKYGFGAYTAVGSTIFDYEFYRIDNYTISGCSPDDEYFEFTSKWRKQ